MIDTPKTCQCSMTTRMLGDGCSVCNPELDAEHRAVNTPTPRTDAESDNNRPSSPLPLGAATCSATFEEWCKTRGVWPRLTHEEIWHTAWNAAIEAADDKAWSKRDFWDEGDGYSPTKAKAAEEIGYAIRTLMSPNK